MRHARGRPAAAATAVLLGAVLVGGVAGSAAATWRDGETVSGAIVTGSVAFTVQWAAGSGKTERTAAQNRDDVLHLTLGPAEAATLYETGELAVPIRVDALAQGNLGLSYEVRMPDPPEDTILGSTELVLVRVADPEDCVLQATPPPPGALTSTPVPATYSDGTAPIPEHWCLLGRLEEAPVAGSYTTTGTVEADSEHGTVSDSDTWTSDVRRDPAEEPDAHIEFRHETFRP